MKSDIPLAVKFSYVTLVIFTIVFTILFFIDYPNWAGPAMTGITGLIYLWYVMGEAKK